MRNSEIRKFNAAVLAQQHIRWLYITVNNPLTMRKGERLGDGTENRSKLGDVRDRPASSKSLLERFA